MRTQFTLAAAAVIGLAGVSISTQAASAQPSAGSADRAFRVVASHLDNPRGLSASDDVVYVAEGGHGDPSHCFHPAGQPTVIAACVGTTGALTRVTVNNDRHGAPTVAVKRIVTGLVSVGNDPSGIGSSGPSAVVDLLNRGVA